MPTKEELLAKAKQPAEDAMRLHSFYRGKVQTLPQCPVRGFDDFAIWYTPGVAAPCRAIHETPELVYEHSNKANTVTVISNGTRVLGLGNNEVYEDQLSAQIPERPYFFCNAPTLRPHQHLAPPGCEQLVMVAPCSYKMFRELRDKSEDEYQAVKTEFAQRIIDTFETEFAPGLSAHIEEKVIGTPLTNVDYVRAPKGNCYSTPLDPKHVNLRRLNYRSPFPNLYYVGASSCLPGFATIIHFANMLYEKMTGDSVY